MITVTNEQLQQVQSYFERWDKTIVSMYGYWFKDVGTQIEVFTDDENEFLVIDKVA